MRRPTPPERRPSFSTSLLTPLKEELFHCLAAKLKESSWSWLNGKGTAYTNPSDHTARHGCTKTGNVDGVEGSLLQSSDRPRGNNSPMVFSFIYGHVVFLQHKKNSFINKRFIVRKYANLGRYTILCVDKKQHTRKIRFFSL